MKKNSSTDVFVATVRRKLEIDRISVSVPKLVKSSVLAWFPFQQVAPRQVSVSSETLSEFRR